MNNISYSCDSSDRDRLKHGRYTVKKTTKQHNTAVKMTEGIVEFVLCKGKLTLPLTLPSPYTEDV